MHQRNGERLRPRVSLSSPGALVRERTAPELSRGKLCAVRRRPRQRFFVGVFGLLAVFRLVAVLRDDFFFAGGVRPLDASAGMLGTTFNFFFAPHSVTS